MPALLFAADAVPERIARGEFFCPDCGAERAYQRVVVRRSLRLPLLPALPLGRYGEFVECLACRATFRPEALAYAHADGADVPAEYRRTMRRVLATMVLADGRVHGREVETVQEIHRALCGRDLSRAEVEAEMVEAGRQPVAVARLLARAMGYLNEYGKEQVLRACVRVSRADGELHRKEAALMRHLGRVLRLPDGRLEAILAELR